MSTSQGMVQTGWTVRTSDGRDLGRSSTSQATPSSSVAGVAWMLLDPQVLSSTRKQDRGSMLAILSIHCQEVEDLGTAIDGRAPPESERRQ